MERINMIETEYVPCTLGCTVNDEHILTAHDNLNGMPGNYSIVRCRNCGLIRTNPRVKSDFIGKYYPENYGPFGGTIVKDKFTVTKNNSCIGLKFLFRKIFAFNTEVIPNIKPGRLLEIGCASGSYLHRMSKLGWEVEGIEHSDLAARNARELGYPVFTGSVETAPEYNEGFNLLVGWMVLEHLYDPIAALSRMRNWANKDAYLVLSVPNIESLEFRFFKHRWYALQLPTHFHHFTPVTIEKLLNKAGWSVEKVFHQRNINNLIVSFGYLLRDQGFKKIGQKFIDFPRKAGYWIYIYYPISYILSIFGQTGRMTIWAKPVINNGE